MVYLWYDALWVFKPPRRFRGLCCRSTGEAGIWRWGLEPGLCVQTQQNALERATCAECGVLFCKKDLDTNGCSFLCILCFLSDWCCEQTFRRFQLSLTEKKTQNAAHSMLKHTHAHFSISWTLNDKGSSPKQRIIWALAALASMRDGYPLRVLHVVLCHNRSSCFKWTRTLTPSVLCGTLLVFQDYQTLKHLLLLFLKHCLHSF